MNLYNWLHSRDEYDTESYMGFTRKCSKGCMSDNIYGDYAYFKRITDTPNEHNNNLIFDQITNFHIKSLFILMDDIFESLQKLFVDKIQKMDEITCHNCGIVMNSQCMEQR